MFKKGLLLTIALTILLIFSIYVSGYAFDYTYTQQSGTGYFVGTGDKADSLEDCNELRTIVNDLGTLLGHSKMDGTYPKDLTTGGTISPTISGGTITGITDLAIADGGTGSSAASGARTNLGLVYGVNVQAHDAALLSIAGLTYVSPSFIELTANDTYAVRTLSEVKTDLSLNNVSNVATDDTAYNATSWNANTDAATKNAIRDKIETIGGGYTNLTSFVDQTAWRLFYSNTDGDVVELALGADGTYLESNGAAAAPTFTTPSGAGDVVKVGTPADSQIGVWTGDGTIEGAASLTYDGSNLQLTGDIGSTGTKITKGWFADLLVTNAISGSVTGNAATVTSFTPASGSLILSGADALTLTTTAATNVTLPTTGTLLANTIEDTTPELGGELDAGAHSIGFTLQTATGDGNTTCNWHLGNKFKFTFGAQNENITFSSPANPCNLLLILVQDGTGSRTATWPSIKWAGGSAPTLTTAANAIDIVSLFYDGSSYYGVASLAFATP